MIKSLAEDLGVERLRDGADGGPLSGAEVDLAGLAQREDADEGGGRGGDADEGAEWLLTRLGAAQVPLALRGRAVERMLGLLAADSEAESRRPKAERRTDQKSIEKRARLVAILGEWQRILGHLDRVSRRD